MKRRLFTLLPVSSLLLSLSAAAAWIWTMEFQLDGPTGIEVTRSLPLLGWISVLLGVITLGLLLWRASQIRKSDADAREGCCAVCGYDLRATPGRCPECGAACEEI